MGRLIQLPRCIKNKDDTEPDTSLLLGSNERKSVVALVTYIAHSRKTDKDTVMALLGDKFGVTAVTEIKIADYEEVIRFLVDLKMDDTVH